MAAKEIMRMRELIDGDSRPMHTGQPIERIHDDTDRDFVMEANEALEYGIIDTVISSRDVSGPHRSDSLSRPDRGQRGIPTASTEGHVGGPRMTRNRVRQTDSARESIAHPEYVADETEEEHQWPSSVTPANS